jgi:16S rRNA processing protein RimM
MTNYIQIGYTQKTHGVAGELKIMIETPFTEDFLKNDRVFLEIKGGKIPYFVEAIRGSDGNIVKFEDIDNREKALSLQSKPVFLREEDLIPDADRELDIPEEETLEFEYLTGFQLHDATLGLVGTIEEVLEMPQQEMAALHYHGQYVLIPLHTALILDINKNGKTIQMDLPEGLL